MGEAVGGPRRSEPLSDRHEIDDCTSEEAARDEWLRRRARSFYVALGFTPSPSEPMMLMVTLSDVLAALKSPSAR